MLSGFPDLVEVVCVHGGVFRGGDAVPDSEAGQIYREVARLILVMNLFRKSRHILSCEIMPA